MNEWVPSAIPGRNVRTFEVVIQRVQEAISAGDLRAGDRLPSERDLAAALGVSRTSVREAIRVLEALGIVRVKTGSGPEHGVSLRQRPGDELVGLFTMWLSLQHIDLNDLVGFREAVEGTACMAELGSEDAVVALSQLNVITAKMSETHAKEDYLELDTEFHQQMLKFSGNRLAIILGGAVRGSIRSQMLAAFNSLEAWDEERDRLTDEHIAIRVHLEAGRQDEARTAVIRHVRRFYSAYVLA